MCDWFVSEAENALIRGTDGREIIDFASGIATLNTGHRHPKIIKAVTEQLQKFTHTAYQIVPYENYINLAEKINLGAPITGAKKSCFFSTGAEAVENAVKIARAHTKRAGIIAFSGAFHGRTMMTLSLTGKVAPYKSDFAIMPSGVFHALFPNKIRNISVEDSLKSIQKIFQTSVAPADVAAIILEPIQGEGGFNIAPKEFIKGVREICNRHGIVFIADEVQTGFGRTGKLFAMEHFDVSPDIITIAKSLGGGFPLSGVVGKASIMDAPNPGGLGGTYAGNPIAISAALAVLDILEEEKLYDRAYTLGIKLTDCLKTIKSDKIAEVRGIGSMVAVEFCDVNKNPNPELTKKVQKNAMENGLLLLTCGSDGNVIRFLYPLTIEEELFNKALTIIKKSIEQAL